MDLAFYRIWKSDRCTYAFGKIVDIIRRICTSVGFDYPTDWIFRRMIHLHLFAVRELMESDGSLHPTDLEPFPIFRFHLEISKSDDPSPVLPVYLGNWVSATSAIDTNTEAGAVTIHGRICCYYGRRSNRCLCIYQ